MNTHLFLYEQLQLLSMRDEDGTLQNRNLVQRVIYALAGAVLMDLISGGFVVLDKEKKCIAKQSKVLEDEALNAVLQRIARAKKPKMAKYWVWNIFAYSTSPEKLLKSLIAKGIVRQELRKEWIIFTMKRFPIKDIAAKQAIIGRLEQLIASTEPQQPMQEYGTLVLLSLVKSARLLPYVFPERFAKNPDGLEADVEAALKKTPTYRNFTDEAIEDAYRRQEVFENLGMALESLAFTVDAVSDAVDSSADAGGGDGGSDGGGGDGGGGSD